MERQPDREALDNRVVVQQLSRCDPLATPPLIEKDHRVGSAAYAVLGKAVSRNVDQGAPILTRKKSAANHVASRIPFKDAVKPLLGFSTIRDIAGECVIGSPPGQHLAHPLDQFGLGSGELGALPQLEIVGAVLGAFGELRPEL